MQLHYYILHDCELKSHGEEGFIRGMATYALARDLEEKHLAYPQEGSRLLVEGMANPEQHLEDLSVHLPEIARRKKDPPDGHIPAAELVKRVEKIVEKGEICVGCPACATAPERFGCWGVLTLPVENATIEWLKEQWAHGVAEKGKSRVERWLQEPDAGAPMARTIVEWDLEGPTYKYEKKVQTKKGPVTVKLGGLIWALAHLDRIDLHQMLELMSDFGGIDWPQLKRVAQSLKPLLAANQPGATEPPSPEELGLPDPSLGPAPFLIQPATKDTHGVREWKTFLYAVYWGLLLGKEIDLRLVPHEEPKTAEAHA